MSRLNCKTTKCLILLVSFLLIAVGARRRVRKRLTGVSIHTKQYGYKYGQVVDAYVTFDPEAIGKRNKLQVFIYQFHKQFYACNGTLDDAVDLKGRHFFTQNAKETKVVHIQFPTELLTSKELYGPTFYFWVVFSGSNAPIKRKQDFAVQDLPHFRVPAPTETMNGTTDETTTKATTKKSRMAKKSAATEFKVLVYDSKLKVKVVEPPTTIDVWFPLMRKFSFWFKVETTLPDEILHITWRLYRIPANGNKVDSCATFKPAVPINLREYLGADAPSHCEANLYGPQVKFPPYSLPLGIIRIAVIITFENGRMYTLWRYIKMVDDHQGIRHMFIEKVKPFADKVSWNPKTEFVYNMADSYFAAGLTAFGHRERPETLYKDVCSGSFSCFMRVRSNKTSVTVPPDKITGATQKRLQFTMTASIKVDGLTYEHHITRLAIYNWNGYLYPISIDIECIRNCGMTFKTTVPAVWRAKCFDCNKDAQIFFKWSVNGRGNLVGDKSKYLSILSLYNAQVTIKLKVVQKYKKGPQKVESQGFATKKIRVASQEGTFTYMEDSQNIDYLAADVRNLNFSFSTGSVSIIQGDIVPYSVFMMVESKEIDKGLSVCSYTSPVFNVVMGLNLNNQDKQDIYVVVAGIQTPSGHRHSSLTVLSPAVGNVTSKMSFATLCRSPFKEAFGLTYIISIASYIYNENILEMDLFECYEHMKVEVERLTYRSTYKDVYRFYTMFFLKNRRFQKDMLQRLLEIKTSIFTETHQPTSELRLFTEWTFDALVDGLVKSYAATVMTLRNRELLRSLVEKVKVTSWEFLRLYEYRDTNMTYSKPGHEIFLIWTEIVKSRNILEISLKSKDLNIYFRLSNIILKTSLEKNPHTVDMFVNMMIYLSYLILPRHPMIEINCGTAILEVEAKTPQIPIILQPWLSEHQIEVEFHKKSLDTLILKVPFNVIEENGVVTESSCSVFTVKPNVHSDLDILVESDEHYNVSIRVARVLYKYQYYHIFEAPVVGNGPFLSQKVRRFTLEDQDIYPFAQTYVIIDLKNKKNSTNDTARPQSVGERKTTNVSVSISEKYCFYYEDEWRSDEKCQLVTNNDPKVVHCRCSVHAPYSAHVVSVVDQLTELTHMLMPKFYGPSYLPIAFAAFSFVLASFIAYWAYYKDIREKDCYQTHVVRDAFNPKSPDLYLVCITTGATPGCGTGARVTFLLIGELGSLSAIAPEGNFSFYSASELWFVVSSDIQLGHIAGVTVSIDTEIRGKRVTKPWYLKKIVVYSHQYNHVILFEANQTLGQHRKTITLPTLKRRSSFRTELVLRFWHAIKTYHTIASVALHVPGKGPSRLESTISSLCTFMVTAALAIEIMGAPKTLSFETAEISVHGKKFGTKLLTLIPLVGFAAILIKVIFSLTFSRRVGLIWDDRHPLSRLQVLSQQQQLVRNISRRFAMKEPFLQPKGLSLISSNQSYSQYLQMDEDKLSFAEHYLTKNVGTYSVQSSDAGRRLKDTNQNRQKVPRKDVLYLSKKTAADCRLHNDHEKMSPKNITSFPLGTKLRRFSSHNPYKLLNISQVAHNSLNASTSQTRVNKSNNANDDPTVGEETRAFHKVLNTFNSLRPSFAASLSPNQSRRPSRGTEGTDIDERYSSHSLRPTDGASPNFKLSLEQKSSKTSFLGLEQKTNLDTDRKSFDQVSAKSLHYVETDLDEITTFYTMRPIYAAIKSFVPRLSMSSGASVSTVKQLSAGTDNQSTKQSRQEDLVQLPSASEKKTSQSSQARFSRGSVSPGDISWSELSTCLYKVWSSHKILQTTVIAATFALTLFCAGWAGYNGLHYSLEEGVDWLIAVLIVITVDIIMVEPLVFFLLGVVSTKFWRKPLYIDQCIQRFKGLKSELYYRELMVDLDIVDNHQTSWMHKQANFNSASLLNLHDSIYKALRKALGAPKIVFHTGVYWTLLYTACIMCLVNLQADIFMGNQQAEHIKNALKLPDKQETPVSVEKLWKYIEYTMIPSLLNMTNGTEPDWSVCRPGPGCMVLSPVRFRQLRVMPTRDDKTTCNLVPQIQIDPKRQCLHEFDEESMETRIFVRNWNTPGGRYSQFVNQRYSYRYRDDFMFWGLDDLPNSGYETAMNLESQHSMLALSEMQASDWLDEHSRVLTIDFTLLNPETSIASVYRLRYNFRRSAPTWQAYGYQIQIERPDNSIYFTFVVGIFFINILIYNLIKEIVMLHKLGLINFLKRASSYVEVIKLLMSILLSYLFFAKRELTRLLLRHLHVSKKAINVWDVQYIDFVELAMLDRAFVVTGASLAFVCILQMFQMLSKIRRMFIFMRMLTSTFTLFLFPLLVGLTFAIPAFLIFGSTSADFMIMRTSYLNVNQYFIKPMAIYKGLAEYHSVLGPIFIFLLGFIINIFINNFFIAFLNEAYSFIQNELRLHKNKVQEKTKMEMVYEFLGLSSTITWDIENEVTLEEQKCQEAALFLELQKFKST